MARGGRLKAMSPDLLSNFAILLLGLSLLVFAGSYFISISIYRKKEF